MLNITLNIIGIILILYSVYIIRKDFSLKKLNKKELLNLEKKEYDKYTEKQNSEFDNMMDSQIKNTSNKEQYTPKTSGPINSIIKEELTETKDKDMDPLHKKIFELQSIGFTDYEIAKKLNKSIREIDIILKVYKR